jgi:hypothetical protein
MLGQVGELGALAHGELGELGAVTHSDVGEAWMSKARASTSSVRTQPSSFSDNTSPPAAPFGACAFRGMCVWC